MGESIGGVFYLSRDILHPKSRAGDAVGNGWWNIGRTFDKSTPLFVDLPATKAILNGFQADLSCTPLFTMRYT